MSYLDANAGRPDPRAAAAVVALHAAMGVILVTGLTVSGVIPTPSPPITGETVTVPLPPPPPEPERREAEAEPVAQSEIFVPLPPLPLPTLGPVLDGTPDVRNDQTTTLTPSSDPTGTATGTVDLPRDLPSPTPTLAKAATRAVPRGDPGRWVTADDYRSRWINEGLVGTARFRLEIGASGRVTDCRVTRSTGHAALDGATCDLIGRRARFTPSRDGNGQAVPGSYEGSIVWRLPE